jgi:hypothetical protein
MKKYFLVVTFCLDCVTSIAQIGIGQYSSRDFKQGDYALPQILPGYLTQGVAGEGNMPGIRSGGTTFIFIGTGGWSNPANWLNGLVAPTIIGAGIDVTIDHQIPGFCTRQGTITILPTGKLSVLQGKLFTINDGGLANEGLIDAPGTYNPGKIRFTGTNIDSLNSPGSIITPIILENKRLYLTGNTNTSSVELTGRSNLRLERFNLSMDTATLVADSTNFIITNDTGRLIRNVAATAVTFPVGVDSTSYTPVTVTNTGIAGNFKVRVAAGVTDQGVQATGRTTGAPITSGTVNLTWLISKDITSGSNITMQWNLADEQSGFDRTQSYISHYQVCPPPVNCTAAFYDAVDRTAASGPPQGPFTLSRDNVTSFETPSFIVTSLPVVYNFIGTGDWNDTQNWTNERVPPRINSETIISNGMEVIINPSSGACNYIGIITLQTGGKLTVPAGKKLNIMPN